MQRAIITVVGKDTIGIIAGVCTYLAENRINILDISQNDRFRVSRGVISHMEADLRQKNEEAGS